MALNRRQKRAYGARVDLYAPNAHTVDPATKEVRSVTYGPSPTHSNVQCLYTPSPEMGEMQVVGRTNSDIVFTLDRFHFDVAVPVDDTWYLQLKVEGHPEYETWWVVEGGPDVTASVGRRRSNYRSVFAKRSMRPPGVSA
jgi:hypothetical protein